eukprot:382476_1
MSLLENNVVSDEEETKRYKFDWEDDELGGELSKTYKALDEADKIHVVIKRFTQDTYKLIKNQIDLLASCKSPFIVKHLREHSLTNFHWVVLEYCDPGPISALHKDEDQKDVKWAENEVKSIVSNIATALAYLHKEKIIHRDVTPDNIFYHQKQNVYKLGDFGASKDVAKSLAKTFDKGAPHFMAPEIAINDGSKYNVKADIWAFGVTLYTLCTGNYPYKGKTQHQLIEKLKTKEPKQLNDDCYCDELREIINVYCLEKDQNKRCSAKDILQHKWFGIEEDSDDKKDDL